LGARCGACPGGSGKFARVESWFHVLQRRYGSGRRERVGLRYGAQQLSEIAVARHDPLIQPLERTAVLLGLASPAVITKHLRHHATPHLAAATEAACQVR